LRIADCGLKNSNGKSNGKTSALFNPKSEIRNPKLPLVPIVLMFVLMLASVAFGEERNPPPEFDNGHELPALTQPAPRAESLQYVDLAALVVALSLASYLAIRRRSRAGMFALMIACIAYFGFYREGCICPIGAIQNVAMAVFDNSYAVPLTVLAFFALPLAFALAFGRTFCAAVCPLGGVQDLVALKPVTVPAWLEHSLGLLPFVYLSVAVLLAATGSAFIICQYDPFVAFFRRNGAWEMLTIGAIILVVGVFVARPYCRFACPYGAILRVLSRLSWKHATITPDRCVQCRLCEGVCPFGAIEKPTTPAPASRRLAGKWTLAAAIVATPILVAVGAFSAKQLAGVTAQVNPTVALARQVFMEDNGQTDEPTLASAAFRASGGEADELYKQAGKIEARHETGLLWVGGFLGLVLGCKIVSLSIRRTRTEFTIEAGRCVSCARCFRACPMERARKKVASKTVASSQ